MVGLLLKTALTMDQNLSSLTKIGNWIATLLLGNTRELIARIDERTIHMQKDIDNIRVDLKDTKSKVGVLSARVETLSVKVDVMSSRMDVMSAKVDDMFPKMEILWMDKSAPAHSRRKLNEYGENVLNGSGIKEIIDERKGQLFDLIKEKGSKNIYDAEEDVLSVVKQLTVRCPEIVDQLKTGAFNTGADLDTVLFVGGIYLRDLILPDLGFPNQP
jgi:hypothetical protein